MDWKRDSEIVPILPSNLVTDIQLTKSSKLVDVWTNIIFYCVHANIALQCYQPTLGQVLISPATYKAYTKWKHDLISEKSPYSKHLPDSSEAVTVIKEPFCFCINLCMAQWRKRLCSTLYNSRLVSKVLHGCIRSLRLDVNFLFEGEKPLRMVLFAGASPDLSFRVWCNFCQSCYQEVP